MLAPASLSRFETEVTAVLVQVGQWLKAKNYSFTTVTPATHAAFLRNARRESACDLRDVFGWNLPFGNSLLPGYLLEQLLSSRLIEMCTSGQFKSKVRYATLGGLILPHSAFPTVENATVFLGPDTYRFAALIQRETAAIALEEAARILDVGCGSGAGGLVAAIGAQPHATSLTLADISTAALQFACASTELAGLSSVTFHQGDLFTGLPSASFDLIVANPPYLNDGARRLYRHGGGKWGEALSIRIVREGLPLLAPGGRLILYTGSCIAGGVDQLHNALQPVLSGQGFSWVYQEVDPDVFGDELQGPQYAGVERIAVVSLVVRKL